MAAIWRVVDRACGTDDLVLDAGLGPHAVALLNARLDDVAVAFGAQHHAAAEPSLFTEFEDFFEGVPAGVVAVWIDGARVVARCHPR